MTRERYKELIKEVRTAFDSGEWMNVDDAVWVIYSEQEEDIECMEEQISKLKEELTKLKSILKDITTLI